MIVYAPLLLEGSLIPVNFAFIIRLISSRIRIAVDP
jgi:hypothetical protein